MSGRKGSFNERNDKSLKLQNIYVRDPYILFFEGMYYLYSKVALDAKEFVVYKSEDMETWSGPKVVFRPAEGFWGQRDFWAPEVHIYNGKFYMFASFKSDIACRGTHILKADAPDGDFAPISDTPITPREWEALDGTLYIDNNGEPHLVFCHEWGQIGDGTVCEMKLSEDLTRAVTAPRVLWSASDYSGSVNAAKDNRLSLVTDGPCLFKSKNGGLCCTWSTMGESGYLVCLSKSDNGDIDGEWHVQQEPLFSGNGGHGMVFRNPSGERCFVMHKPNIHPLERASIYILKEREDGFVLEGGE